MAGSEAAGVETDNAQEVSSEGVESVHQDSQEKTLGDDDDDVVPAKKRSANDVEGFEAIHGGARKASKASKPAADFVKCELCPRPASIVNSDPQEQCQLSSLC